VGRNRPESSGTNGDRRFAGIHAPLVARRTHTQRTAPGKRSARGCLQRIRRDHRAGVFRRRLQDYALRRHLWRHIRRCLPRQLRRGFIRLHSPYELRDVVAGRQDDLDRVASSLLLVVLLQALAQPVPDGPLKCLSQMYLSICATIGERTKASEESTASSSARSAWRSSSAGIALAPTIRLNEVYHLAGIATPSTRPCYAGTLCISRSWGIRSSPT
jgi:hypothetical protein